MTRLRSRLTAIASAFTLTIGAACSDSTGPNTIPGHVTLVVNSPGANVTFSAIRIILKRSNGNTAADTSVAFPSGATSLSVDVSVPLAAGTGSTGEQFAMTLNYLTAQGATVFTGNATVTATPK
jgi:hypothetical protein